MCVGAYIASAIIEHNSNLKKGGVCACVSSRVCIHMHTVLVAIHKIRAQSAGPK